MTEQQALSGRGAVVVGGGSGIGLAVAELLAEHGAGVVINSRNEAAVQRAVETIRGAGGSAQGVAGSAADEVVAGRLIAACTSAYDNVDILVNCAGIAEPVGSSILDVSTDDWQTMIDSHLTTVFNTCRAAAPLMVARGSGSIINTGFVRLPRRLRRHRLPRRKRRGHQLDARDGCRNAAIGSTSQCRLPRSQDTTVDRSRLRDSHPRSAPPRPTRRTDHAGIARCAASRVCGAAVPVPRLRHRPPDHR